MDGGYVPSWCTACYRQGRTGEHFMEICKAGESANRQPPIYERLHGGPPLCGDSHCMVYMVDRVLVVRQCIMLGLPCWVLSRRWLWQPRSCMMNR